MHDPAPTTGPEDPLVARLIDAGEDLPAAVEEALLARGRAAVPALLEVLSTAEARDDASPGTGFGPLHAAALLGQLQAVEAIAPLLGVLRSCDPLDLLYSSVIASLESLGPPVLEPALAAHRAAQTAEERAAIADVLSGLGIRDDRVLSLLVAMLDEDVDLAPALLARYGDPAALPALGLALDRLELDPDGGPFSNGAAFELEAAVEELGGTLSAEQRRKVAQAKRLRPGVGGSRREGADLGAERDDERDDEREELVRRFSESWHAAGADTFWVGIALEYASTYDGARFADLDAGTLREVVFQLIPRKVSCEPSAASEIIRSLRAFWTFAADELHHPHAAACLAMLGDDAIPRLTRELEDPENFGMAKSFFMSGLGAGGVSGEPSRPRGSADRARKKKARRAKKRAQRRNRR